MPLRHVEAVEALGLDLYGDKNVQLSTLTLWD